MLTCTYYLALYQKWKCFLSCIPQYAKYFARYLALCDMLSPRQKEKFLLQVLLETQTLICITYLANPSLDV